MLIQLPDNTPIRYIALFAGMCGYQLRWKPDNEIEAELFPVKQPQPAEAVSEVGNE